ncbi:MAG: hypothetical protein ACRDOI_42335 [Trebonia sp.]
MRRRHPHPGPGEPAQYAKPYASQEDYLDSLAGNLALAALGPKVLALAAKRTAGAHPYSTTPEHTRQAREILGPGPLLAPEQKVLPERARSAAKTSVSSSA